MRSKSIRRVVGSGIGCVLACLLGIFMMAPPVAAQSGSAAELAAFQTRVDAYVAMHRRIEGPLPPMEATKDLNEARQLKEVLRNRIRVERGTRGTLITPGLVDAFKQVIGSTLTLADVVNISEEVEEHTPPRMAKIRVNAPLPDTAPFVTIPPTLLRALPQLPPELRYVALSGALIIWDQHADLVVDIMPRLFDPLMYSRKTGQ
jgi:hypothetical protein